MGAIRRRIEGALRDPRDWPFIPLALTMTAILVPLAVTLFLPGRFRWWLGGTYLFINMVVFGDQFVFMNHMAWHSPVFKKRWGFLNNYLPWVLGPLFGIPSQLYVSHHIMMHHADDNLPVDRSSTMRFQRDSFVDFLRYMFRFMFAVSFDLVAYHREKKRRKGVERAIVGESCMMVAIVLLTVLNWRASLFVAILPSFLMRFFMMVGNWGNHAFIDPKAPENFYRSSCNIINTRHNKRNFNDGYHIAHHLHATMHWADLPAELEKNIDVYAREDALVFERINYFVIWFLVVTSNFDKLATYIVTLPGAPARSREEKVAMLRERVQPIRSGSESVKGSAPAAALSA